MRTEAAPSGSPPSARGPGRGRGGLRRGPVRARAARRGGADPRPGRGRGAVRVRPGSARRPRTGTGSGSARCSPRCGQRLLDGDRRAGDRFRDVGVVGFDIAGAEAGHPPPGTWTRSSTCSGRTRTSPSTPVRRSGCPRSAGAAVVRCGRLGQGFGSSTTSPSPRTARRAGYLRPAGRVRPGQADPAGAVPVLQRADRRGQVDRRAPDRAAGPAAVPGHRQHRQPADERLLDVLGDAGARDAFGYGWAELQWLTVNAMKSSFLPFDERLAMINDVIKPGYADLLP